MTANIEAAKAALSHLDLDEDPESIRNNSRDFFWYSPVLKKRLDHVTGDFVVSPRSEEEVIEVVKACFANDVPITTRGWGTGNYGQAMRWPAVASCTCAICPRSKRSTPAASLWNRVAG